MPAPGNIREHRIELMSLMIVESANSLPSSPAAVEPFRVGEWLVEPALNRLSRAGDTVHLQPRIMHVLVCLAAVPGRVVTREALLDTVWRDAVVCEDALTRTVSTLRRSLADDTRAPRFIETISKGGYRLVARVTPATGEEDGGGTPVAPSRERGADQIPPPAPVDAGPAPRTSTVASGPVRRRKRITTILALPALAVLVTAVFWIQSAQTAGPEQPRLLRGTPFTTFPGNEIDPALSPDGTQLAFAWNGGGEEGEYDIYIKQRNTETPLKLTSLTGIERYPAWSPDGSELAFAGREDDREGIFAVPTIGGPARRLLYSEAQITGLDWSPDGCRIAYSFGYQEGRQPCIMMLELESGRLRAITDPAPPNISDRRPAFSPDGRQLAFLRRVGQFQEDIHLVAVEGGEVRPLTACQRWITGLDWSADGERVIFGAAPDGTYRLWEVGAAGGPASRLSTPGRLVQSPTTALHTGCLAYEEVSFEYNIWQVRVPRDGQSAAEAGTNPQTMPQPIPEPFIRSTRIDYNPHFSPDGSRVVFVSSRSGSREIWVCDADGGHPRQLTRFGDRYLSRPRWSPDGRQIAYGATPDDKPAIFLLDPATGKSRRLSHAGLNARFEDWSPNGKWIYFNSDRDGSNQLWRIAPDGGQLQQVTRRGGHYVCPSADGRVVYYCRPGEAGIWQVPSGGGEEACWLELPGMEEWVAWRVGEQGIHYIRCEGDGFLLAHHDLDSGLIRPLGRIARYSSPFFTVSPDGRTVLFEQVDHLERDLILVDQVF